MMKKVTCGTFQRPVFWHVATGLSILSLWLILVLAPTSTNPWLGDMTWPAVALFGLALVSITRVRVLARSAG